jgi:hypothetical protein
LQLARQRVLIVPSDSAFFHSQTYIRAVNSFMPSSSGVSILDLYVNGDKVRYKVLCGS